MKIRRRSVGGALCAALLLTASGPSRAWGWEGHETIGEIADQLIAGTAAERQVRLLLGSIHLREAAVWADCAKGIQPSGTYPYHPELVASACTVFAKGTGVAAMRDYVRRNQRNCTLEPGDEGVCHKLYHYTDVAIQEPAHARGLVGTSDHDVVASIAACIAVLKGQPAPAPFAIKDQREALLLLAHFVGDIHQPLHVGSVYLDARGRRFNPASGRYDPRTNKTAGGNALTIAASSMHTRWDAVPAALSPAKPIDNLVARARLVPPTTGPIADWPQAWATDTLQGAGKAFDGVKFGAAAKKVWPTTLPAGYSVAMDGSKQTQVATAGARLAQTLRAVWPR